MKHKIYIGVNYTQSINQNPLVTQVSVSTWALYAF